MKTRFLVLIAALCCLIACEQDDGGMTTPSTTPNPTNPTNPSAPSPVIPLPDYYVFYWLDSVPDTLGLWEVDTLNLTNCTFGYGDTVTPWPQRIEDVYTQFVEVIGTNGTDQINFSFSRWMDSSAINITLDTIIDRKIVDEISRAWPVLDDGLPFYSMFGDLNGTSWGISTTISYTGVTISNIDTIANPQPNGPFLILEGTMQYGWGSSTQANDVLIEGSFRIPYGVLP